MEVAIRWSTSATRDAQNFLIADVDGKSISYCEATSVSNNKVSYKTLFTRENLPNFTAFDWSRADESLVAIGTAVGEARVLKVQPSEPRSSASNKQPQHDHVHSFPIRQQRKCNSIAFSRNGWLAAGFDRARNDSSLNVYDVKDGAPSGGDPLKRLSTSEVVSSTKFFGDEPDVMIAGIYRQCIRLYDLKDPNTTQAPYFPTRQVHTLSIDPLDDNYFASVGPQGENVVSVWDRRVFRSSSSSFSDPSQTAAVLEIKPAIESSRYNIWSLRYTGYKRGCFTFSSSAGQVRSIDVARFPSETVPGQQQQQSPDALHYVKRSHDLQRPWYDQNRGREESTQIVAFDHTRPDSLSDKGGIITICQDRSLEFIPMPSPPPVYNLLPSGVLCAQIDDYEESWSPERKSTVAEDLVKIQEEAWLLKHGHSEEGINGTDIQSLSLNQRSKMFGPMTKLSSRERHQELLNLSFSDVKLPLSRILTALDTQRRRCWEGYLFDCERNKEIVKNDAWLVGLWDTIQRMESMANDDGMVHDIVDFSFLGVAAIWKADVGSGPHRILRRTLKTINFNSCIENIMGKHRIPSFEGVLETSFPDRRQLGLAICGWKFTEKALREKCNEILDRGELYKAIVVAVCHGFRQVAIEVLRSATKARLIDNSGLAAVIACSTVNEEQRSLCEWMAEDAEDPYLRALLAYFVSGDWNSVVEMAELPLVYRVAVALKYLPDSQLGAFLERETADTIRYGDIEGVVLTGLSEQSMDLFQAYIARTNDVQTAVLATAFTNPKYVVDQRWDMWKESYFGYMQGWRAFIPRTHFNVQHTRKAVDRNGKRLIAPPPRQVSLRCNHCQGTITRRDPGNEAGFDDGSSTVSLVTARGKGAGPPNTAAGAACPRCGRPMPRCSICMQWVGSPDPALPGVRAMEDQDKADPMALMIVFCMSCKHCFHSHHAKLWFAKHHVCPVPDCQCLCASKQ